jgi:hypothetical protein
MRETLLALVVYSALFIHSPLPPQSLSLCGNQKFNLFNGPLFFYLIMRIIILQHHTHGYFEACFRLVSNLFSKQTQAKPSFRREARRGALRSINPIRVGASGKSLRQHRGGDLSSPKSTDGFQSFGGL